MSENESRNSPPVTGPRSPCQISAPRVSKEFSSETSENSLKVRFQTLYADSLETSGRTLSGLRGAQAGGSSFGTLFGLFSDFSGFRAEKGLGDPVPGGANPKYCIVWEFPVVSFSQATKLGASGLGF